MHVVTSFRAAQVRQPGARHVAMSLAGVEELIPVSTQMLSRWEVGQKMISLDGFETPVKQDLRGLFSDSVEAYEWALEDVMPRCSPRYAHTPAGPDADGIHTGMGPFKGFDYWRVS